MLPPTRPLSFRMLSFIVPAHDEAALIGATLRAIHDAADALQLPFETIVVADACTDDTARIAAGCGARVLSVAHRHIAATRNSGAAVAVGTHLVFVDADTQVNAHVLAAAMSAMADGAIGGGCAVRFPPSARWNERLFTAALMRVFRRTGIAPGCFLFCTRAAFAAVGGFDTRWFAGEDVAMSRALAAHGRFVILHASVQTSDRKMRTFGLPDHLRLMLRFSLGGRRILRSREQLALWYGTRRHDDR
jgi:glycosyltransferase involved in cell wall biosynthesis